jgi:hypothetical protein
MDRPRHSVMSNFKMEVLMLGWLRPTTPIRELIRVKV